MKVCFVGLGSIGKRHLKNLYFICKQRNVDLEIHALRSSNKELPKEIADLIDKSMDNENDLEEYDIVFITNPTSLHYNAISLLGEKTKNMFIEKPLFESTKYELNSLNLKDKGVYYIAAPMRYTNVLMKLKEIIKYENVYSIRCICSSYLPNWRKNVDYRDIYSASRKLGGGISLDCIHEWDYIVDLFGFPEEVFEIIGKYSHLEIDSDDIAVYIGRYQDKVVELHLDYIGRESKREIELYTKNGTIIGDFINNEIRFTDGRDTIKFENDDDDIYIRELNKFLSMIFEETKNDNDIKHAYDVLKLARRE